MTRQDVLDEATRRIAGVLADHRVGWDEARDCAANMVQALEGCVSDEECRDTADAVVRRVQDVVMQHVGAKCLQEWVFATSEK